MSKSIRSYPKEEQNKVILRRLAGDSKGLGYWAAMDAQSRIKRESKSES